MTDSTQTTFEEARTCPACESPGIRINSRPAPRGAEFAPGTRVEMFECRNDARCPDYIAPQTYGGTTMPASRSRWAIQVNPDGSIPPRNIGKTQPKAFEALNEHSAAAQHARDQLRYMAEADTNPTGQGAYEIGRDLGYR